MSGRLGILVTNSKYSNDVIGLSRAALDLGKGVSVFLTDEGTALIRDEKFLKLIGEGAQVSACGHSAEQREIGKEEVEGLGIRFTTQFENAIMAQDSERYVVF